MPPISLIQKISSQYLISLSQKDHHSLRNPTALLEIKGAIISFKIEQYIFCKERVEAEFIGNYSSLEQNSFTLNLNNKIEQVIKFIEYKKNEFRQIEPENKVIIEEFDILKHECFTLPAELKKIEQKKENAAHYQERIEISLEELSHLLAADASLIKNIAAANSKRAKEIATHKFVNILKIFPLTLILLPLKVSFDLATLYSFLTYSQKLPPFLRTDRLG